MIKKIITHFLSLLWAVWFGALTFSYIADYFLVESFGGFIPPVLVFLFCYFIGIRMFRKVVNSKVAFLICTAIPILAFFYPPTSGFENPDLYFAKTAEKTKNTMYCPLTKWPFGCYRKIAALTGDYKLCDKDVPIDDAGIPSVVERNRCYSNVAEKNNNPEICSLLPNTDLFDSVNKNSCLETVAVRQGNDSLCAETTNPKLCKEFVQKKLKKY